jgi:hypothetical protein
MNRWCEELLHRRWHSCGASDALRDFGSVLPLDDSDVVLALQIEPELRTVSKIVAEPHGGIGRNRPAAVQYVSNSAGRNAQIECKPVRTEITRLDLALQKTSRMYCERHGLTPMVINNLDVVCVAVPEYKTDAPACI